MGRSTVPPFLHTSWMNFTIGHGKARDPIGMVITGVRNTVMNKLNHVRIARMI